MTQGWALLTFLAGPLDPAQVQTKKLHLVLSLPEYQKCSMMLRSCLRPFRGCHKFPRVISVHEIWWAGFGPKAGHQKPAVQSTSSCQCLALGPALAPVGSFLTAVVPATTSVMRGWDEALTQPGRRATVKKL